MTLLIPPQALSLRNIHLEQVRQSGLDSLCALDTAAQRSRYLFLCFTNRCGSTLLSHSIASDGSLNAAGEFFNGGTIVDNANHQGLRSFGEYFNFLVPHVARNGILVAKLAITNLLLLAEMGVLEQILDQSVFVILERGDKLGQAISLSIADQNQKWSATHPAVINDDDLVFDYNQITTLISGISFEYNMFSLMFSLNGITPLIISYETLRLCPQLVISQIAKRLDLSLRYEPTAITTERQAGTINQTWRERYLAQRSGAPTDTTAMHCKPIS
ncbi:Stf0 family sulfotransferase [Acidiphilium sp.]|uniref:Stf0 family sulfotransferase n=1 Tax=Acidiphilium sp. TaxID=527 RepID=UPI003D028B6B